MGSETEYEPNSTPKLSFNSLPTKQFKSPGMLTSPFHASASIPFSWEDAPGKPRACTTTTNTTTATTTPPKSKRSLELPPRLLTDHAKVTNTPSPTTVLDGPYAGRALSHTLSFSFRKRSFRNPEGGVQGDGKREICKEKWNLSSCRWGSFKENSEVIFGDSFDFSASANAIESGHTKVKITRVIRRNSFFNFSQTGSNIWASIYGNFKQAVPWRRNQEKQRKQRSA